MARPTSIGVIGDFDPSFAPHVATGAALEHAAAWLGAQVDVRWLGTAELELLSLEQLANHDALWCAPGSPYRSLGGALRAIRFARESDWPFIGTCGGFQHVVIAYARNVLGFEDAQHAEYDPYASELFISELSCSLAGQTMNVRLKPGSRAAGFYGQVEVAEQYYTAACRLASKRVDRNAAGLLMLGAMVGDKPVARPFPYVPGHVV